MATETNAPRDATPRVLGQWRSSDLENTVSSVAKTDFKLLSSYNWLEQENEADGRPGIVVPGKHYLPRQLEDTHIQVEVLTRCFFNLFRISRSMESIKFT